MGRAAALTRTRTRHAGGADTGSRHGGASAGGRGHTGGVGRGSICDGHARTPTCSSRKPGRDAGRLGRSVQLVHPDSEAIAGGHAELREENTAPVLALLDNLLSSIFDMIPNWIEGGDHTKRPTHYLHGGSLQLEHVWTSIAASSTTIAGTRNGRRWRSACLRPLHSLGKRGRRG